MKPLGNRVLIEPIKDSLQNESGIVRPEDSKKKEVSKGKVVAVGDDVRRVSVDDIVLFSPYHYDEISKELFIIEDIDIWVVLPETTTGTE